MSTPAGTPGPWKIPCGSSFSVSIASIRSVPVNHRRTVDPGRPGRRRRPCSPVRRHRIRWTC